MIVLGAIAVDLSHLHAARTDLQGRADAAANDAATAGLDQEALRAGRGYRLDPARAANAASSAIPIQESRMRLDDGLERRVDDRSRHRARRRRVASYRARQASSASMALA